jgi:hypothetical protein
MKLEMRYTIVLLSLVLLFGCKTKKAPIKEVPLQYREKIVERLVPVQAPADSANIVARLRCDSLNRVILTSLTELKSKGVESSLSINNGLLTYDFRTAPALSYAKVRDSIVSREVPVNVYLDKPVNFITWWQRLWIAVGKGSGVLLAILLGFFIVKSLIVQK